MLIELSAKRTKQQMTRAACAVTGRHYYLRSVRYWIHVDDSSRIMFVTDRLALREWEAKDRDGFMRIWNDPQCNQTISNMYNTPVSTEKAEEMLKRMFGDALLALAITLKEDGTFMGWVGFSCTNRKNRDAMLGISLLPEFWNKGYGTEATKFIVDYGFRELNLHRISLGVFEGNDRAKKVYERMYVISFVGAKVKADAFIVGSLLKVSNEDATG